MTLSSFKSLQHVRLNSKKMMKNRMLLSYWKYLIWLSNINGYFWRILLFWKWSRTKRPKYPSPWNALFSTGAGGAQTRRSFENHLLHPLILRFSLLNMCIRWFWGPEISFIEQTVHCTRRSKFLTHALAFSLPPFLSDKHTGPKGMDKIPQSHPPL